MRTRAALLAAALVAGLPLAAPAQTMQLPAPLPSSTPTAPDAPRPIAFAALPLDAAQNAALATSPDVAAARAVVRENSASLAAARAALGPALTANYAEAPQGGNAGETIAQRLTTVGVQTTIGDLVAYGPLVASAAATLRSAQASLAAAQRAERVRLVGLYYDALKARAIAQARAEALQTARQQRNAAAVRLRAGDAPRLDVVRADVAVARATATAATATAADQNATEALRVETATSAPLDRTVDQRLPSGPAPAPDAAAAQARLRRADLLAAAETTAAARAAAAAARRQTFPAVTLTAGYTRGVDAGVVVHGPALTVSMNLPLTGVARAQAAQRDAVVAENLAKQQGLERQVALDVAASARNLEAARRATAATTQARDQARAEFEATLLGYRNGASSSLEVAAARDTYTQAVVDDLSSVYDELKARASLDLETGP